VKALQCPTRGLPLGPLGTCLDTTALTRTLVPASSHAVPVTVPTVVWLVVVANPQVANEGQVLLIEVAPMGMGMSPHGHHPHHPHPHPQVTSETLAAPTHTAIVHTRLATFRASDS
jgi:hypothetical protein